LRDYHRPAHAELFEHVKGHRIARSVVDDDDLAWLLLADGGEGLPQVLPIVEARNDDGNAWS
jgi:hypothetical protein